MKHIITGFITCQMMPCGIDPVIGFLPFDPRKYGSSYDQVVVCEHSFEIDVPDDFDPTPLKIAALQAEKEKVKADFAKRVMEIDAEIGKLLAITNDVKS